MSRTNSEGNYSVLVAMRVTTELNWTEGCGTSNLDEKWPWIVYTGNYIMLDAIKQTAKLLKTECIARL